MTRLNRTPEGARCIECGRSREDHAADGTCQGENPHWSGRKRFATMDLPDGKTCDDCARFRFCSAFIGDVRGNTTCDWFPIRYAHQAIADIKAVDQ